jgi:hypothetical protein
MVIGWSLPVVSSYYAGSGAFVPDGEAPGDLSGRARHDFPDLKHEAIKLRTRIKVDLTIFIALLDALVRLRQHHAGRDDPAAESPSRAASRFQTGS